MSRYEFLARLIEDTLQPPHSKSDRQWGRNHDQTKMKGGESVIILAQSAAVIGIFGSHTRMTTRNSNARRRQ
jgi:hypothetical protein